MTNQHKHRRKKMIVNQPLQRRVILDVCMMPMIVLTIATVTALSSFLYGMLQWEWASTGAEGYMKVYLLLLAMMSLVFITSCYVTVKTAIKVSHRIAGPLYRLHQSIDQVLQGDTKFRITFRKDDYMTETAEAFNRLLDHMENQGMEPPSPQESWEEGREDNAEVCACAKHSDS